MHALDDLAKTALHHLAEISTLGRETSEHTWFAGEARFTTNSRMRQQHQSTLSVKRRESLGAVDIRNVMSPP